MSSKSWPLGRRAPLGCGRGTSIAFLLTRAGLARAGVVVGALVGLGLGTASAQDKKGQPNPPPGATAPERLAKDRTAVKPNTGAPGKAAAPAGADPAANLVVDENDVNLSAFSEPVQLSALVSMLADSLGINIAIKGDVPGTVVFNAPVTIKKDEFYNLVNELLGQQGYNIVQGVAGFHNVVPVGEISFDTGGTRPSTRVIATPNLKPTALQAAITAQLAGQSASSPCRARTCRL